ncbi:MAG: hypothetical protein KF821_06675 [Anaerolineales bacterium]|nr:hypothetical protein [Anaerolineales bacterium]
MEKKHKKSHWPVLVWVFILLATIHNYAIVVLQKDSFAGTSQFISELGWTSVGTVFAIVSALIISNNRRHTIGWLLMLMPIMLTISSILNFFIKPAVQAGQVNFAVYFYLWFNSWSWWILIGSIILIFFLFPTGRLISKKWRWGLISLGIGFLVFLFAATFSTFFEDQTSSITVSNPIGFLPIEATGIFIALMGLFLITPALASVVSVFVRYRDSQATERAQMRWLFIAGAFFLLVYIPTFIFQNYSETTVSGFLFIASILAIPLSIGIAILRYRLWDVDVVINRSLVYGALTTLLAALFAGTAALLSQLAKAAFGEDMQQAAAAVAAIVVASLFTPLRTRVEGAINRRLFPENIDLSQGLIELDANLWSWVKLPKVLASTLEHLEAIYGHEQSAIYLLAGQSYKPVALRGLKKSELKNFVPSKAEQELLEHKKGILTENGKPFVLTVPIYLGRRKGPELLGVLRLGKRKQGRGFSGGDIKTLAAFGAKLGEPIYALHRQHT